jgi:leucyl-tRNA synthetase
MKKGKTVPQYNFAKIEKKWQKTWQEKKTYEVDIEGAKKPFYNLMMFPYPSAEGLHVGGVYTYTGVDAFGRFKKMQGYDVFEPIGLDGFGIHSENYAMKIGEHIDQVSKRTEKNFYRQLGSIGNMFDWSRTVETYKPEYYRWTQWLFLQLFKKGLAYQKKAKVNWCPSCKTVLSDEQVIQGQCERCDSFVEKRELKQWFFRITKYADRLLKNLDWIDWPEDIKTNQRNWIGKSEGANIKFQVEYAGEIKTELEVFTTRPDTLFGATYMVLAPEHELVKEAKESIENWAEVDKYIKKAISKSEQERKNDEKIKTGVELKGILAINPASGEKIPVWVADYVLAGYGTGAIMAVPAHDQRDFEFAEKFGIETREVVVKETGTPNKDAIEKRGGCAVVFDPGQQKYAALERKDGVLIFCSGGANDGESLYDSVLRETKEESGLHNYSHVEQVAHAYTNYFNNVKKHRVCGLALCNLVILEDTHRLPLGREDHEKSFSLKWVSPEEIYKSWEKDSSNDGSFDHWRWFLSQAVARAIVLGYDKTSDRNIYKKEVFAGQGRSINSDFLNGLETKEAKKKMLEWLEEKNVGKKSIDFKLRDWCVSRQRYWGPPIPIVWCKECAKKENKTKVLLIHGFEADGKGNWFPELKTALEKEGCEVFAPSMSTTMNPDFETWMKELQPFLDKLDENSIIVGHSLGSAAALHLLSGTKKKIKKVFMVASAIGNQPRPNWDILETKWEKSDVQALKRFWQHEIDWASVNESILKETRVILSLDDPWVDPDHYKLVELDDVVLEKWDGFRHFSTTSCPKLTSYIVENIVGDIEPVAIPVPDEQLPVKLPPMEDFLPEGTGKGPLARNAEFVKTMCPVCGADAERETDVSDPFVDSSWYFFRYPSTDINDAIFDKERTKKWLPVDSYIGGKEHTVLHLLYSRFITMVLKDLGYIDFEEPYKRFFGHGLITKEGVKMSKSKGNVVNPDVMIEKFGADTTRMYLRFLGDFSQGGDWRDSGIEGMNRFVKRLWTLFFELEGKGNGVSNFSMIDKTIKVVGEDLERLSFNTAVARLMEFVNWGKENKDEFNEEQVEKIRRTIALIFLPFMPHLAEEFWQEVGDEGLACEQMWPEYDKNKIVDDEIELVVQINGKLRDKIKTLKDISEEDAKKLALESENVQKFIAEKEVRKVIYVKGKLVSIVV